MAPAGYGRDFVFVDDLIGACLRAPAVARSPAEVFNVGFGALTTIEELVTTLAAVVGVAATYTARALLGRRLGRGSNVRGHRQGRNAPLLASTAPVA